MTDDASPSSNDRRIYIKCLDGEVVSIEERYIVAPEAWLRANQYEHLHIGNRSRTISENINIQRLTMTAGGHGDESMMFGCSESNPFDLKDLEEISIEIAKAQAEKTEAELAEARDRARAALPEGSFPLDVLENMTNASSASAAAASSGAVASSNVNPDEPEVPSVVIGEPHPMSYEYGVDPEAFGRPEVVRKAFQWLVNHHTTEHRIPVPHDPNKIRIVEDGSEPTDFDVRPQMPCESYAVKQVLESRGVRAEVYDVLHAVAMAYARRAETPENCPAATSNPAALKSAKKYVDDTTKKARAANVTDEEFRIATDVASKAATDAAYADRAFLGNITTELRRLRKLGEILQIDSLVRSIDVHICLFLLDHSRNSIRRALGHTHEYTAVEERDKIIEKEAWAKPEGFVPEPLDTQAAYDEWFAKLQSDAIVFGDWETLD